MLSSQSELTPWRMDVAPELPTTAPCHCKRTQVLCHHAVSLRYGDCPVSSGIAWYSQSRSHLALGSSVDPAMLVSRIAASGIAPLIKRLFMTPGKGAGLTDRPVNLSGYVSFRGEKCTLTERDLAKLASELVSRCLRSIPPMSALPTTR